MIKIEKRKIGKWETDKTYKNDKKKKEKNEKLGK